MRTLLAEDFMPAPIDMPGSNGLLGAPDVVHAPKSGEIQAAPVQPVSYTYAWRKKLGIVGEISRIIAPPGFVAPAAFKACFPVRATSADEKKVASSPAPAGAPQVVPAAVSRTHPGGDPGVSKLSKNWKIEVVELSTAATLPAKPDGCE